MKYIFLISIIIVMAACSAKISGPAQQDVDRVQAKFPGYTLGELNNGKRLYEANCSLCHGLKKVSDYTEVQWNELVPAMVKKVNKKTGTQTIDDTGSSQILKYVMTMGPLKK